MSKNIRELPATEIVERAGEIARIDPNLDPQRIWGALNDAYVRNLPNRTDWSFFLASSALVTERAYSTGNVTINTGDTAATFSGAALTASMVGSRIKFFENSNVYEITAVSSSSNATITPPLSEGTNISSGAFTIANPFYALPRDFDRFPKNGGLKLMQGGRIKVIEESFLQTYYGEYMPSPGTPEKCRILQRGTASLDHVELSPPPSKALSIPYDYFKVPAPLRETTGGTATINAGSSSVTLHGSTVAEAGTGWYFRINAFGKAAASEWYRVLAISGSSLTIQTAFGISGATSAGYTLCMAPEIPTKMHMAVLWGAVKELLADQDDPLYIMADSRESAVITEGMRLYKTRIYNQSIELPMEDYNYYR